VNGANENEYEVASQESAAGPIAPAGGPGGCACGASKGSASPATHSYVYALGRIQPRFPSLAIEREFLQVVGRADSAGLTDRQAAHAVLSKRENRYLARKLCWTMSIESIDTYLLVPRDPIDVELLIESLREAVRPTDVDVVVGLRGAIAPPEMCNGLQVPIVGFDQIYSFDVNALLQAVPRPQNIPEKNFHAASEELFYRVMLMADNAGSTDEHRALNYLVVRYPAVFATVAQAFERGESLSAVNVRPSQLGGTRKVVDVIFSFTNRSTDVTEKYFVRVDVAEEFPFLVTKMSPFFNH
jgi:PatG Domain